MKKLLTIALLALAAPLAFAQAKLLPAQSELGFTSKQMGVPVDGKFKKFDAQLTGFDPKKPDAAKVSLTIDMASASLGDPAIDAELVKGDWFDAKKSPQATFQSTAVKATGAGKYEVAGKLTIKGQVRDVVVPMTLAQAGGVSTATGAFPIKRLAFKIGQGDWADTSVVADDVQVKFKLAFSGIAAQ